MRITFVRPNLRETRSRDAMEPLCFAILKSLTPRGIETVLHDERLEPIPLDEPTDLAALTVETFTARRAYQIADGFRRRGVPVVMGGYHPTFLPEECLEHADAVVQGDAEGVWPQVVEDAATGRLRRIYTREGFPPMSGPLPDRSVFAGKRYARLTLVQYGRGCRFNCDFCSIRAFYGSSVRQRSIEEVVEELRGRGGNHVFFVDDNLFVDEAKAAALFEALIPLRIRWSCQTSIDVARDRALVRLMARSGCTTAVVGFESLDIENLRQMRKGWNLKWAPYEASIRILQDAGIMLYGTFVFGYDLDTAASFDRVSDFAQRNRFFLANFNPLTPTPRAPLLDRLRREGRLLVDRWWLDPSYRYGQATFRPRGMTADELTEGCWRARKRFYSYRSIGRRLVAPRTNLRSAHRAGIYLAANLISRREIHAKQGSPLGESVVPVASVGCA
ncbi:MAG TPA: radical SAM protein [Candidatus Polarisedimenticolia bacterium]|nr:radical SAM protein [Candidatus Polarisedimenticolia bacterium]